MTTHDAARTHTPRERLRCIPPRLLLDGGNSLAMLQNDLNDVTVQVVNLNVDAQIKANEAAVTTFYLNALHKPISVDDIQICIAAKRDRPSSTTRLAVEALAAGEVNSRSHFFCRWCRTRRPRLSGCSPMRILYHAIDGRCAGRQESFERVSSIGKSAMATLRIE